MQYFLEDWQGSNSPQVDTGQTQRVTLELCQTET